MNKLYEQQLILNKHKIEEKVASQTKKSNKVAEPEEPESDLAKYTGVDMAWDAAGTVDPTGVVDIVNAGRYALKGRLGDAAISLAGVIPYAGDLAKLGRAGKAAGKAIGAGAEVKGFKVTQPLKVEPVAPAKQKTKLDLDTRTTIGSSGAASRRKSLSRAVASTTTAGVAGAAAGFAIGNTVANMGDKPSDDDKEFKKMIVEPPHQTQLDIRKLGAFDPGEASGYAKSVITKRGHDSEHPGYHPFFTGPMSVELQRRRSSYAHSKGLPESVETDNVIKRKIKSSVNNYLKSREGRKLNDHLENIRKTIAFE